MTIPNLAGLEIAVEIEAEGWRAIGDDIAGLVAHAVRAGACRRGAGAGRRRWRPGAWLVK